MKYKVFNCSLKKKLVIALFIFLGSHQANAQGDSLLEMLESDMNVSPSYTTSTFRGTRLVNFHTCEVVQLNSLDFRISHRFSDLNSGLKNLYGLDGPASMRLGLEYSPDGRFQFGMGRTNVEKMLDGFIKYRLLRQRVDDKIPISVTLLSCIDITTMEDQEKVLTGVDRYQYFSSRLSYAFQLMIAKKFNDKFSFQLAPSLVHYNLVQAISDRNDIFSIVGVSKFMLRKRIALSGEYCYNINHYSSDKEKKYFNSASIGLDFITDGHVFSIDFSNSIGIDESQTIARTTGNWLKGEVKLGFNISRTFSFKPNHKG